VRVLADNVLNVYVDGSSQPNPRRGGFAVRYVWTDDGGREQNFETSSVSWTGTTNNEMELQAVIAALEGATGRRALPAAQSFRKIVINTDSEYVAENYRRALFEWSVNGWKTRQGRVPENLGQWRQLVTLVRRASRERKLVEINQIPRRSDDHSRRVDNLAKRSAKSPLKARELRPRQITRRRSPNPMEARSFSPHDQVEVIRVTGNHVLGSPHRGWRYRFEVVGGSQADCVDHADSEEIMHRSHYYRVRFNDDPVQPRIDEVLEEVDPETIAS
jgi:ribonuclease HI